MKRRDFLTQLGGASALAMSTKGSAQTALNPEVKPPFISEQGFFNPCHAVLPPALASHQVVRAAWEGLDPAQCWDAHAHVVGTGDSNSGVVVNPAMYSVFSARQFVQRIFFMNAGCVNESPGKVDQSYVDRMRNLLESMPLRLGASGAIAVRQHTGAKLMLFAFDYHVRADGSEHPEESAFYVPNSYAAKLAALHPEYFEWAASIHPYRNDCVQRLEQAVTTGARAIKWLPAAMGMDPGSPRCDKFYEALKRLNIPLITHAGLERAVHGADKQHYGNPLRLRRALDHGVRVVVAHCASMGDDIDTDKGPNATATLPCFDLFARLMDDAKYGANLYGDISAMTQINRAGRPLKAVIERSHWHPRLLYGSDYPLPGVMPLYSVDFLVRAGYLDAATGAVLTEVRKFNPLLFSFVLARSLKVAGKSLAATVFMTRPFFQRVR